MKLGKLLNGELGELLYCEMLYVEMLYGEMLLPVRMVYKSQARKLEK